MSNISTYRIRNWDQQYENNITRKIKNLNWVATPNKHDGRGFRRLMRMRDGVSLYGAWHLILQVASKMPTRGVLADIDGPLSPADIADKTGASEDIILRSLEACCTPEIGWVERDGESPIRENIPTYRDDLPTLREIIPASPDVPGPDPGIPGVIEGRKGREGREQKGREGSEGGEWSLEHPTPPLSDSEFAEPDRTAMAWNLVDELIPHHWSTANKPACRHAVEKLLSTAVHPEIMIATLRANHASWANWLKANPRERKKQLQFWLTDDDWMNPAPTPGPSTPLRGAAAMAYIRAEAERNGE